MTLIEMMDTIIAQGGRYKTDRLVYAVKTWLATDGEPETCIRRGCHGLEGIAGAELFQPEAFMAAVHRIDPGNFPCPRCGSTGIVAPETREAT